jgi:hypothetical protein
LYKLGEYEECETIGDSIQDVFNVYDAHISSYSAMASYRIAFEYKFVEPGESIDFSAIRGHLEHAKFKAKYALEYYDECFLAFGENIETKTKNSYVTEHLVDMNLALKCCDIVNSKGVIDYLLRLYTCLIELPTEVKYDNLCIILEELYCDIAIHLLNKDYTPIENGLLKEFEETILEISTDDYATQLRAAEIYADLSDALNAAAYLDKRNDVSPIGEIALNTMIHSRDYSLYAKKNSKKGIFQFHSWKDVQDKMAENSISLIYFTTHSEDSDSMNYAWRFTDKDITPQIEYAGHTYSNIKFEAIDYATIDYRDITFNAYYIVGTDDMSQLDIMSVSNYLINSKIVRLYSISEIINLKDKYDNSGYVVAFANLNYSSCKIEGQSEDKGLAKRYGKFASAIKEIEILESIFVDNLITYQSEEATRDKFMSLSKETKILHISTHGFFDKGMLKDLNKINPNVDAAGENIFKSCGLLLSGYNDDKTKYLSAYDVINQDFSGVDFVFLSACDSGMGKVLSRGDYSLVSAFKISGAKNIIAILSPINEDVATKFAGSFYDLISRGLSYHEAFYETSHKVALKNGTIILIE